MTTLQKPTDIIVTDKRIQYRGEGSTGLAIKDAQKQADAVLDTRSNSLRDDAIAVPYGDRVNVKRIQEAEVSAMGISIPKTAQTPPAFGVVVGKGQGRYNIMGQLIPIRVEVGAVVMFGKYAGSDLPMFGVAHKNAEPLLCLRDEEIMQIIMTRADYEAIQAQNPEPEIVGVSK